MSPPKCLYGVHKFRALAGAQGGQQPVECTKCGLRTSRQVKASSDRRPTT